MIVYRSAETVEQTTPFDCKPFTDTLDPSKGSTLMVTQKKDDTLTLPSGVAFTLDPNQMVRLEMHYINASPAPVDVTASTNFITMADAQFKDEAGLPLHRRPGHHHPAATRATTLGPIFFALPPEYSRRELLRASPGTSTSSAPT